MDFTFLYIFSWIAFVSTVALFFTGIPICYKIWKRKSSENFTSVPFMMGVISASFWLRYALLKDEATVLKVNIVALSLNTVYLLIYYCYTKKKMLINLAIASVIATEVAMITFVELYKTEFTVDILGVCCTLFNIICFGSPLAGLRTVFRQGNCETLPLPMSIGNFIVSSEWFLYGILTENIYIIVPNSIGVCLATIQLLLFLVFPTKSGSEAILEKLRKNIAQKNEEKAKKSWISKIIQHQMLAGPMVLKKSFTVPTDGKIDIVVVDKASLSGSDVTEYTDLGQTPSEKRESISLQIE